MVNQPIGPTNQLDFNNTTTTTTITTTSDNYQQFSSDDINHNKVDFNPKSCKTTSSIVVKTNDTKKSSSVNIENLSQISPSDDNEGELDQSVNKQSKAKTQALTFSEIKSSRRQTSESTATDDILPKRETSTSRSPSPPSPKKAKSASDVVKESMKSKRVSNSVETHIDVRPRSPSKETSFHLKNSYQIIPSEKSVSPDRMSTGSSSGSHSPKYSPTRSRASPTKESSVSYKSEYKRDAEIKSKSSKSVSPERKDSFTKISSSLSAHSEASQSEIKKSSSKKDKEIKKAFSSLKENQEESHETYSSAKENGHKIERSSPTTKESTGKTVRLVTEEDFSKTEKSVKIQKPRSGSFGEQELCLTESNLPLPVSTFTERKIETNLIESSTGLSSQSVSTELTGAYTQMLELPPDGWCLKDAIDKKLFDSESGMFAIPGTDRLVSFEETIRLEIINPNSAVVVEPGKSKRKISLLRSFDKSILDSTGHYYSSKGDKKKLSMKEAIASKLIQFEDVKKVSDKSQSMATKVLRITSSDGEPDKLDIIKYSDKTQRSLLDIPESTILKAEESILETVQEQFIEIDDDIYYSPKSDTILFHKTGERMNLMEAIRSRKVNAKVFSVKDLDSGKSISMQDAIKKGIINKETGELISKKTKKTVPLKELAKEGLLFLATSPSALTNTLSSYLKSSSHEEAISKSIVSDLDNEQQVSSLRSSSPTKESPDMSTTNIVRETVQVIKSRELFIKDPKTGKEVPLDEAVKLGIIDEQTAINLKTKDAALEGFQVQKALEVTIQDPATGVALPLNLAVRRGIIDAETAKRLEKGEVIENLVKTNVTLVETPTNVQQPESLSKAASQKPSSSSPVSSRKASPTRSRSPPKTLKPLTEPSFAVVVGNAQTIQSPEKEVNIQKLSKRSISPKGAAQENLIDEETADLISSVPQSLSLEEAIVQNLVDGDKGSILNPQTGEKITINKALQLGLIDSDKKSFVYPLGRSLSLPSIIEKGVFNPKERRIIHPETGELLSLELAISCDIVDKHSKLIDPKTKKSITLEDALKKGVIDAVNCDITTASERKMSLVEAVKTNYISLPSSMTLPSVSQSESPIPQIALTYRAALQSGLVNTDTSEFIHPITKESMTISKAIEKGFILDILKYNDSTLITETPTLMSQNQTIATEVPSKPLSSQIIETSLKSSISKKIPKKDKTLDETESLKKEESNDITKKKSISGVDKESTEGESLVFSIDSRTQSQVSTKQLVKTTLETVITSKGEVTLRASSAVQSIADAMKSGELNLATGTYTVPNTGETISISEALRRNILQSQEISSSEKESGVHKYTISGAFNWLYVKESDKFKEPETGKLVSFEELVKKGYIDMDAVIYDAIEGNTKTTRQAIEEGKIDSKTGNLIDTRTKKKISITDATKLGLMAVIGAPIVAGKSVCDAVVQAFDSSKSKISKASISTNTEGSPPTPKRTTASIKSQTEVNDQEMSTTTTVTTSNLRTYTEVRKEWIVCSK
jgi:hypothetical protein